MADDGWRGWWLALAAALALHLAALWLVQPARYGVSAAAQPMTWRVQVHTRTQPVTPPPAIPAAPPATPQPAKRPVTPRPTRATARAPAPAPAVEEIIPNPPPPVEPPPVAHADPAPRADSARLWLDANLADRAPTPIDNEWRLAEMPWPDAYPTIEVQLWIDSDGRIERFELQGEAASDPVVQQLFASFSETPMRPAYFRSVPVPSTMRIQLWQGDGPEPDFVAPLAPASR